MGRKAQAKRRQAEEDEEDLDKEWRVPDQLDIGIHQPSQGPGTGSLDQGAEDGDEQADQHRAGRELDRQPGTFQQLIVALYDRIKPESVTQEPPPILLAFFGRDFSLDQMTFGRK